MPSQSSGAQRGVFLALAVILIIGGITGISTVDNHWVGVIGGAIALLAGLTFLKKAANA